MLLKNGTGTFDNYCDCATTKMYLDKPDEVLEFYNKAIEVKPKSGIAYYYRGFYKLQHNDKVGACLDLKKAEELGVHKSPHADEICK